MPLCHRWPLAQVLPRIPGVLHRSVKLAAAALLPHRHIDLPVKPLRMLSVELTNICNANCGFCAYRFRTRPPCVMEESLYRKILGEFAQAGGGKLSLTVSVGDPLMDPALIERIRYARSIPAITSIGTISNCLNLHAFDTDALLTSGLTTMTISTCGFNEERYHRLYRSAVPYARMKENILHLLRRNSALGKPVAIEVGLRIDEPEKKVLKEEGFDEVVRLAAHTNTLLLYDSWRNHVTQKDLTGTMRLRPHVPRAIRASAPCAYPFAPELTVLCNGAVTLCGCHELNGDSDLVIGNSMHQTLQEIYASPKLRGILEKWYYRRRLPRQCYFCNQYHPARFTR